jgi:hypothetical protein
MKPFLTLLLLALLAASASAQTIKTLGYTTNGEVVYAGTNTLTFTNAVTFSDQGSTGLTVGFLNINGSIGGSFVFNKPLAFDDIFSEDIVEQSRTNLGLVLPALTNTSNVTMMRALAGSTNTNAPFSGTLTVDDTALQANVQVIISNGIIVEVVVP